MTPAGARELLEAAILRQLSVAREPGVPDFGAMADVILSAADEYACAAAGEVWDRGGAAVVAEHERIAGAARARLESAADEVRRNQRWAA